MNVEWTRGYILRKLRELRIFISNQSVSGYDVTEAMAALSGPEGVRTSAEICDFILKKLGHNPAAMSANGATVRAARKARNAEG